MIRQWLTENAPGYSTLPSKDRSAIQSFVLLWTLFEARVMNNSARADHIRAKVDEWDAAGILGAESYDADLAYFRRRYFAHNALTPRFHHLELRPQDHPALVEAVIRGQNNGPRDRVLAVLMVVWRYRNNLFHGAKWSYQLRGQRGNFTHACHVLMRVLERHGNLWD